MQRRYRLKSGRVFDYLHRKGVSSANKRLVLVHAPSKYPLKVGFIVSKKVGKAVVRNNSTFAQLAGSLTSLLQRSKLIVKTIDAETATKLSLDEKFINANVN